METAVEGGCASGRAKCTYDDNSGQYGGDNPASQGAGSWMQCDGRGAVLNQEYADMIGADFYGKDAMQSVYYAQRLFKGTEMMYPFLYKNLY